MKYFLVLNSFLFASAFIYGQKNNRLTYLQKLDQIEKQKIKCTLKIKPLIKVKQDYEKTFLSHDSVYARILHRLGSFYYQDGKIDSAIYYTEKAIEINHKSEANTEPSYLTNSYFNLGYYYMQLLMPEQSILYFDSCIQLSTKYPGKENIMLMAFEKLTHEYSTIGNYHKAINLAKIGINLSKKLKSDYGIVHQGLIANQLFFARINLNDLETINKDILQTITNLTKIDLNNQNLILHYNYAYALLLNTYALALRKQGDYDKSIEFFNKAYEINKKNDDEKCIENLIELAVLYDKGLKNITKALNSYEKALSLNKNDSKKNRAIIFNGIGNVYWRSSQFEKALLYFQKALNTLIGKNNISNPSKEEIKYATNEYYLGTILANKGETLLDIGKNTENRTQLQNALATFYLADYCIDNMRKGQYNQNSKLFWRKNFKKFYTNAIETCYLLDDVNSAFYFMEKSRALLLADELIELKARNALDNRDRNKLKSLKIDIFLAKQKFEKKSKLDDNSALNKLVKLSEKEEKYILELEKKYPLYKYHKYIADSLSIKEVQQNLLGNKKTLVEFLSMDKIIFTLVIKPDTVFLEKTICDNFSKTLIEFVEYCKTPSNKKEDFFNFQQKSHYLYSKFIAPLNISTPSVIISPGDNFLPFEALITNPETPNSYFLNDHAISYIHSANFWNKTKPTNSYLPNTFYGIAPETYHTKSKLKSLNGSISSLKEISTNPSAFYLDCGEKATKDNFLKQFPNYSLAHVYVHGEGNPEDGEPVLHFRNSSLKLSELKTLKNKNTKLVYLAACETGVGKKAEGEGVLNYSRGFNSIGIPSTISSLWEIDNHSTYEIAENFYFHLKSGAPFDQALQKAKLDFMETSDQEHNHPYYWSANVLIGPSFILERKNELTSLFLTVLVLLLLDANLVLILFGKTFVQKIKHSFKKLKK